VATGSNLLSSILGTITWIYGKKWKGTLFLYTTLWSRVLEKLTGFQLVKKFPAFYGTRRFITAFTSACHLSPLLYPWELDLEL